MRILMTWIVALLLLSVVTSTWYITQPLGYLMATGSNTAFQNMNPTNATSTKMSQTVSLLLFFNLVWGPITDLAIVLWAVISSQQRDVESELYG